MTKLQTIASIPLALLAAGIYITSLAKDTSVPDSEQVSKLLSEAKTQAFQLKEDASTMEAYTRSNLGWESHAAAIEQMKEHINAAGRTQAPVIARLFELPTMRTGTGSDKREGNASKATSDFGRKMMSRVSEALSTIS